MAMITVAGLAAVSSLTTTTSISHHPPLIPHRAPQPILFAGGEFGAHSGTAAFGSCVIAIIRLIRAIIAYLLDMPFGTAMASILAGVVLAGGIMTTLTLAGKAGALVALGVLVAGGVGAIANARKSEGGDEPAAA